MWRGTSLKALVVLVWRRSLFSEITSYYWTLPGLQPEAEVKRRHPPPVLGCRPNQMWRFEGFVNKKTNVANADPLLLEHQKCWTNKLAQRKSAIAKKLRSHDSSNCLHLSTAKKKRLFNHVTLQPCVQLVGAHIIVVVKMSCHFSDRGCSHNKEALKLSVWNRINGVIPSGARLRNSFLWTSPKV